MGSERRQGRPRIDDVARAAGVSKTAVSFAFNSPERLAVETAPRIREVAENLGYSPDPIARLLTQGRTMTLGVLTPQALAVMFSNPFFSLFGEGVAEAAEDLGYELHLIPPVLGSMAVAVDRGWSCLARGFGPITSSRNGPRSMAARQQSSAPGGRASGRPPSWP